MVAMAMMLLALAAFAAAPVLAADSPVKIVFVAPFVNAAPAPEPYPNPGMYPNPYAAYIQAAHDSLENLLANREVPLVDRDRVGATLKSMPQRDREGMSAGEAMMALGKRVGADILVSGSLLSAGRQVIQSNAYGAETNKVTVRAQLQVRVSDIATGRILMSRVLSGEAKFPNSSFGGVYADDTVSQVIKDAIAHADEPELIAALGGKAGARPPAAAEAAAPPADSPKPATPEGGPVVFIPTFELAGPNSPYRSYYRGEDAGSTTETARSMLEDLLINRKIKIVERKQIPQMLGEAEYSNQGGMMDTSTAVKIGKGVGANFIVLGTVLNVANETIRPPSAERNERSVISTVKLQLRLRVIDIATGEITFSRVLDGQASTTTKEQHNEWGYGSTRSRESNDLTHRALKDAITRAMSAKLLNAIAPKRAEAGAGAGDAGRGEGFDVLFSPTPDKCDVLIDGEFRGTTPLTLSLTGQKPSKVQLRKAGYQAWEAAFTPTPNLHKIDPVLSPTGAAAVAYAPPTDATRVDLLKRLDPVKDGVKGVWSLKTGMLHCDAAEHARIEIPYTPREDYDLRVTFTRESGTGEVFAVLTSGETQFAWVVGALQNQAAGFDQVDGKRAHENASTKRKSSGWVSTGRRHVLMVKVRKDGVEGWLDDELLSALKIDFIKLRLREVNLLHQTATLGLGAESSVVEFESAELFEFAGGDKGAANAGGAPRR